MLMKPTSTKLQLKLKYHLERSQKLSLKKYVLMFTLIASSAFSFAQKANEIEPLITDRPDQTESPNAMPKGFLQVETGAYYESFKDNNIKTEDFTFNTTLVRYGLLDNLELRLGWDFVEGKTKVNGNALANVSSGFNPLLLGVKTSIAKENGYFPEIGLLGHIYLPFSASTDLNQKPQGSILGLLLPIPSAKIQVYRIISVPLGEMILLKPLTFTPWPLGKTLRIIWALTRNYTAIYQKTVKPTTFGTQG